MTTKINQLLDKYWADETTLDEEAEIKQYFHSDHIADEHLPFADLFTFFEYQGQIKSPVDTEIDILLNKYWEGETTQKEERILQAYFKSEQVAQEHEAFTSLFAFFDHQREIITNITADIETILDKYWEGEANEKEEQIIKAYFKSGQIAESHQPFADLFEFFEEQKQIIYPNQVIPLQAKDGNEKTERANKGRIISILGRVAAVAIFVIGAIFIFKNVQEVNHSATTATNVYVVEDPEEALRITREALAMVSTKFRESQETLKDNLNTIEKIDIFKTE